MMNELGTHGWGMDFGWLFGTIILVIIIWLVIRIINQNSNSGPAHHISALDILKERYARGEISKEEFEEKKQQIL